MENVKLGSMPGVLSEHFWPVAYGCWLANGQTASVVEEEKVDLVIMSPRRHAELRH